MINSDTNPEARLRQRNLTLDLIGLSTDERENGSIFLGGLSAQFVQPGDQFDYGCVDTVLFEWGDPKAKGVFASMLEHDTRPDVTMSQLFPFAATTLVKDDLWMLAVQDKSFDPSKVYPRPDLYSVAPYYRDTGPRVIEEYINRPIPRNQLLGKVGLRWVLFEMSLKIK